jgi:outer membrane protein
MRKIGLFFVFLGGMLTVNGQDTLSLMGAIQEGLVNSFDIQLQRLDLQVAGNNREQANQAKFPLVSLTIGQNNSVIQRKPANPFAVAGQNISHNVPGQLNAQFILFQGFYLRITRDQLKELEDLSAGNVALVIENTVQNIVLAYYTALLEEQRLLVLHRVMDFSRQQYEYVKLRRELGSAITFDVLNEQNNYLTDSANFLMQQVAYKNSIRSLNVLLNEEIARNYQLTDSLYFQQADYEYADLYEQMTSSNTNLKNQYINREVTRLTTQSARSGLYPTLSFNAGASGSLDQLNASFRSNTGNTIQNVVGYDINGDSVVNTVNETTLSRQTQHGHSYGVYGNFALSWNLFNAGQVRTTIENAKIEERMSDLTIQQLKRQLEGELLLAYDQYNLRQELVNVAGVKLKAAELNLSLANERYKNGSISAIDLRIIQENFRTAALENFSAIYDAIESRTNLIRLTGGLVSQYDDPSSK